MSQGRFKVETIDSLPGMSLPPCPEIVKSNPIALAEWNRVLEELTDNGTLQSSDMVTIASYCILWGRVCDVQKAISSFVTILKREIPHIHPMLRELVPMLSELRQLARALNLTPSSRKANNIPESATGKRLADLESYMKGDK